MGKANSLGSFLKTFKQMVHDDYKRVKHSLGSVEDGSKQVPRFSFIGYYRGGWKAGVRIISSIFPYGEGFEFDQPDTSGYEAWIEDPRTFAKLSAFYDDQDQLIGRSYFDLGDLKIEEVRDNLKLWESLVQKGPKTEDAEELALSAEEIYELIKNREAYKEVEGGRKQKYTVLLCIQDIAIMLSHPDADDEEIDRNEAIVQKIYERLRKKERLGNM